MWSELTKVGGVTDTVTLPDDGILSVTMPPGVELCAYINGSMAPMHHLHVKGGDTVHFKLESHSKIPAVIDISYNGSAYKLLVTPEKEEEVYHKPIPVLEIPKQEVPVGYPINSIEEEDVMSHVPEINNIFKTNPVGDASGMAGMAGLIPLLALTGALGGRRDGYGDNCGAEKVAVMNAGFDGINHNINTSMVGLSNQLGTATIGLTNQLNTGFNGQRDLDIMQKLGNIEGDVWKAEGQVQLALATAQSDINNRIADGTLTTVTGQALINKNISDAIAASLASQSIIRHDVATSAAVNQATTLNAKYELSKEIRDDGDKTRALVTRQYEDTLNRQLAVAQDALLEQRSFARQREVEVNVTQNVNQNQAQLQQQQQQQQQFLVTNNLLQAILCQAQVAQATNQSLIIGNTGAVVGGPQAANPTNVRA